MSKKQVVVIHGGNTFNTYEDYINYIKNYKIEDESYFKKEDWKINLENKLGEDFSVLAPRMPNSKNAKFREWEIWFDKVLPFIHEDSIFVGHSLGATFLVKYLSQHKIHKSIKGVILVAGVYTNSGLDESLADFEPDESFSLSENQIKNIVAFHSKDDEVVPFSQLDYLKQKVSILKSVEMDGRGHFNRSDFPELISEIKRICG